MLLVVIPYVQIHFVRTNLSKLLSEVFIMSQTPESLWSWVCPLGLTIDLRCDSLLPYSYYFHAIDNSQQKQSQVFLLQEIEMQRVK